MSEDRGDALSRLIGQATTGIIAQQFAALGAQLSSLGAQPMVFPFLQTKPGVQKFTPGMQALNELKPQVFELSAWLQ